jgi:glycosyltransferase involved in cell wall biosynthesis
MTMGWSSYPSSRLRVFSYLPGLRDEFEYDVMPFTSELMFKKQIDLACRRPSNVLVKLLRYSESAALIVADRLHAYYFYLALLSCRKRYDIVFVQKVILPRWIVKSIKQRWHAHLIFDFDDAIFLKELTGSQRLIGRVDYIIERADTVVTVGDYNREYARKLNGNVRLLLTPVDIKRYKPRSATSHPKKLVVGWVGTPGETRHLKAFLPVWEEIDRRCPVSFRFIGARPFENRLKDVRFISWNYDTEVQHMWEFDIGIMPLIRQKEVFGKGGYKLLQYMAMGIPSVASPWGVNRDIIDNGKTGLLAESYEDWLEHLDTLLKNKELRRQIGNSARAVAVESYSLQRWLPIFVNMLEECVLTPRP